MNTHMRLSPVVLAAAITIGLGSPAWAAQHTLEEPLMIASVPP